jgi:hypothetical protein
VSARQSFSAIAPLLASMAALAVAFAAEQAPTPILERRLSVGNRTVRTSMFSNSVVVVSVRYDGEQVMFRQIKLDRDEFTGYIAAIQRDAEDIDKADYPPSVESMGGHGEITLHIGPQAPRNIEYSPVAVLDLATARLVAAIDDLEARVFWGDPSNAELEGWTPRRGDRVQMRSGVLAEVIEVRLDGTIVVEHDDTWINEIIPPEHRAKVILSVLKDDR